MESEPKKNERRYILDMNEEQAIMLKNALEFYSRIIIGQWNEIGELLLDMRDENYVEKKKALDDGMNELRKLVYPELPYNGSYGVAHIPRACEAWEIYQVIRHRLAWTRNPTGSWTRDFDRPISFSGKPLAKCCVEEREESAT